MIGGRRPLVGLHELLNQSDRVGAKSPIFELCSERFSRNT